MSILVKFEHDPLIRADEKSFVSSSTWTSLSSQKDDRSSSVSSISSEDSLSESN